MSTEFTNKLSHAVLLYHILTTQMREKNKNGFCTIQCFRKWKMKGKNQQISNQKI